MSGSYSRFLEKEPWTNTFSIDNCVCVCVLDTFEAVLVGKFPLKS